MARAPEKITLRDVTEVIDGVCQDQCSLSLGAACPVQGMCTIQDILHHVEEQHLEALAKINFAEIAAQLMLHQEAEVHV